MHRISRVLAGLISTFIVGAVAANAAELRIALAADITSMDPQYANLPGNLTAAKHMFESLADIDADGRLVPTLAQSWKRVDARTWEFHLRPGVRFQDGSPLTAEDVLYSLARPATLTNSPATLNGFLKDIVKAESPEPGVVRLTTSSALAVLPNYLTVVPIVSKKATEGLRPEDFETGRGMVGTGPYKFVKFLRGDRLELARNELYWGSKPHFDKAVLRVMPNAPARTAALLSGEVDAITAAPAADLPRIQQNAKLMVYKKPTARANFWVMNQYSEALPGGTDLAGKPLSGNPLKDVRVRKAFSKALDRDAIASRAMEGLGVATQNTIPGTMFGYNPELKPERQDVEGARKLLAEAGYPNCFGLSLYARNDNHPTDPIQAQAVGQMLSKLGCKVRVESIPTSVLFTRANKLELGMMLMSAGTDGGDMGVSMEYMFSNPTNNPFRKINIQTYDSPAFWKPLREALESTDDSRRAELYRQVSKVLHDEVGIIPTTLLVGTWAARKGIQIKPRVDERLYAFEASE